ncbi:MULTISPECIES: LPXTG cell wall anchor domain-containing protein [Streptomyces]|uniref:LPXTG cell wall anchor domain-containing protein n=1 Tax=Streptomyces caniscabiei TaxID=2746961 RepID=A0ABU4MP48_9ACTN|nr:MULTISPECIES: LPXTG cell wall anchor domain-containing protein [Streptomyces]MBE4739999.1 LPXTG cell wall anchor domain-containing protein [Streptomyces caniscabiei]MBE4758889.1 LPXTG cell wall anchor domain-containing protein [Streptomyces caniscabiei]MBE4770010.1 LPXTG cell wall anchor domain-containing protein [Streptomyces caniscabiei]MBE4785155.1 LPXTG cell wall anchor domain-containing protein [Streptomyces caniscabiei]MBE4797740.1 LPXTG cell wall anchor domain-containing protein [Str
MWGAEVSYRTYQKRTAVLASLAALAGSAVLMAAPVAHAEVVDVEYNCKTPIGDKSAVSPIDIKGVESGDGYKITMSWQKGVSSSPVELGKGAMTPSATIALGGADSGTLTVTGPANEEALPANTPIKINDLSGTYTPKKTGKVEFTAGVLTIKALGTVTTCTPGNDPAPSLTLDVTAGGGSGGGSDTGGSGGSNASGGTGGSGGELPQTGPLDSAVALGTLGGTVLLAGTAGVLWVTRRNQAVRR